MNLPARIDPPEPASAGGAVVRANAAQLPIPADVQPGPGWTDQMLEMAEHIGPYLTLRVVEAYGGETLEIPADPARNRLRHVVGDDAAAILSRVYRRELVTVPVGRVALRRARWAPVLAEVRAKRMTVADAARRLGTSRTYLSHLVNDTDEGTDADAPPPGRRRDPRQTDLFAD